MSEPHHTATLAELAERLQSLDPVQLEITDESHLHAGHAGAKGGAHFRLHIVSQRFNGLPSLARHRLVMTAAGDLMTAKIHALSIRAQTPDDV